MPGISSAASSSMQPFELAPIMAGRVAVFGAEVGRYRLFLIVCGALVLAVSLLGLGKTRYGARVRAAVDNERDARGTGINVQVRSAGAARTSSAGPRSAGP